MIACYLNPGVEAEDRRYLQSEDGSQILFQQMAGEYDFPLQVPRWEKWFLSRVRRVGLPMQELIRNVAILNVCAYASQNADQITVALLKKLPSAQIARRYLHEVLIPQAQRGERFLVICRGAWAWQAPRNLAGKNVAFAYPRGGHLGADIGNRISTWLASRRAES